MKVFVTGGTGSIGAHLVKRLLNRGYTVHALVRTPQKADPLQHENLKLFKGDLESQDDIDRAMEGCEQAYHLAAYARVWAKDTGEFFRQNAGVTVNVMKSAEKHGVKRMVYTSTAGVLGPSLHGDITEKKVRDKDFFNEYESSKAYAELKAREYAAECDLDLIIVSPTRVYGPFLFGEPTSITLMIDKYVNGAWRVYPGSGKQIGNYVYIEDCAEGHILAMERGRPGHTYILGGDNHNYIEFYGKLAEVSDVKKRMYKMPIWTQMAFAKYQLFMANKFGKEPIITPKWIARGRYDWVLNANKAKEELGMPVTPLEEGLKKTVEWLKSRKND